MSDSDSFIEEVNDEVRRDRLYGYIREYGWIAVLAVVLLVGGAAYSEWRAAQERAAAQATGDAILSALELEEAEARVEALDAIPSDDPGARAIAGLMQSAAALDAGGTEEAADALQAMANTPDLPDHYRELAILKRAILLSGSLTPEARIEMLGPLTAPGAPYALLAGEQIALAEAEQGDTDAAISRLRAILDEEGVSAGLRRRASQLIVALGGDLSAS
ncbi:hypothetical protein [Anianabacter salinae]|uniref:hypothetical protein n=1 Tax=Anianabacter salinae TaxID=2851023 RepID=UPI00225DE9BB|nr:hypothetical protein [Anianabacter salinae]MBV0912884.1 tetratricopeptide repeat protein [Anianabacter salinae]